LQDAISHRVDTSRGTGGGTDERRIARRAVLDAYREFPLRDDWGYFKRRGQFITEASQSTGTIAYDHSGGDHERMLTLSGATWPDNVRYCALDIVHEHLQLEDCKSQTFFIQRYM